MYKGKKLPLFLLPFFFSPLLHQVQLIMHLLKFKSISCKLITFIVFGLILKSEDISKENRAGQKKCYLYIDSL